MIYKLKWILMGAVSVMNGFDLNKFYEECSSGKTVNTSGIFSYIKSFKNIILWGAAFQGKAIGKRLKMESIAHKYWDMRYQEIVEVDGIAVNPPFTDDFDKDQTLIIYCIPNHVIMKRLIRELNVNGYKNIIRGDILYSGIVCKCNEDIGVSAARCWGTRECRSVICSRAANIIKKKNLVKKPGDRIDLTYCVFVINSICNLSCRDCVQYINNYPQKCRNNVSYDTISRDIDAFLGILDSVGTISVMGGETFMHPEIGRIVKKFSEHKNFGFLSLPTNGLFPIQPQQLEEIKDPRIIVAFGYYLHVADEKQKEVYRKNVELVKSYGLTYTESNRLPEWIDTGGIAKLNVDENYLRNKKAACKMPPRNLQVKNGKVHICDRSLALHNMELVDYPNDYLDLTQPRKLDESRQALRELIDREFYHTCAHCGHYKKMVPAGVQGIKDVFSIKSFEQ